MHSIFYYIGVYLVISALGIHLANRKVEREIARQRWIKYVSYLLIISTVIASIIYNRFYWIALLILFISGFELGYANYFMAQKRSNGFWLALPVFLILAFGFFLFSIRFPPALQLFIYFQVFTFDAFCQITGQLVGKHQLSRSISPSKTIEGLIGGILFCILSAFLARSWVDLSFYVAIGFGAFTSFTAFCGDMLASYFKRTINIKDYSKLLPGQGGFLDRFDSLILTGAVYFLLLRLILADQSGILATRITQIQIQHG